MAGYLDCDVRLTPSSIHYILIYQCLYSLYFKQKRTTMTSHENIRHLLAQGELSYHLIKKAGNLTQKYIERSEVGNPGIDATGKNGFLFESL